MTAAVIASIGYVVDTKAIQTAQQRFNDLDRKVNEVEKSTSRMAKGFSSVGTAIKGLAALGAISSVIQGVISNTIEMEKSAALLDSTLKSTGRYTPELSATMKAYASSLQAVTVFGDDAIIASQGLLAKFTQIAGDTFPRAQEAILDVASALDKDLNQATLQIGKALNDPIKGLTTLRSIGITFTDSQKDMVKSMVAAGDVAGAQGIILGELEKRYDGAAEAARDTLGGSLKGLKNAFGDLFEGDSSIGGTKDAVNELTAELSKPATKQAFADIAQGVLAIATATAAAMAELVPFAIWVKDELNHAFTGKIKDDDLVRLDDEVNRLNAKAANNRKGGRRGSSYDPTLPAQIAAATKRRDDAYAAAAERSRKQQEDLAKGANKPNVPVSGASSTPSTSSTKSNNTAMKQAERDAARAASEKKRLEEQAMREEQARLATMESLRSQYAYTELQRIEEKYAKARELAQANITDKQLLAQVELGIEAKKLAAIDALNNKADEDRKAAEEARQESNKTSFDKWLENTKQGLMSMEDVYSQAFDGMTDVLTDFVMTGKLNFADFAKSIIASIIRIQIQMMLLKALQGASGGGGLAALLTMADGGAFSKGVQLFANGGVVNRPTGFAHRGGLGVMGEAGPEAIMPLARGKNGKLGVVAQTGHSGAQTINMSTTVNITGNASKEDGAAIGQQVANAQRQLIKQELANQSRSGNMLNPGLTGF